MSKRSTMGIALAIVVGGAMIGGASSLAEGVGTQAREQVIQVTIDVKPGDNPTTIEPKREGMVPIAILSSKQFDAAQVDPSSVRGGAQGTEASIFRSALEDIDNDRDTDMMLLFRVQELKLSCEGKSITVTGKTTDGKAFAGTEVVTMAGC
jgi:hypothetical protein